MPFQRIVVGVDFSTGSLNAVRWLASAFAPASRIFVVHVVAQPRLPPFLRSLVAPDARDEVSALYPGLRAFAGFAGGDPADAIVARGNPSAELARIAAEVDADLVCVGRSRRRRGSGRFGATTPQRLLVHTGVPMLIVPENARAASGAVLAATSDGRDAAEVIEVGGTLAHARGVRLDALHTLEHEVVDFARSVPQVVEPEVATVWSPALTGAGASVAAATSLDDARLRALARDWVAATLCEHAPARVRSRAIACVGDAGEEIVAHAAREGIGLIVAGRRVRHQAAEPAPGGAGLGSTTRLVTWATSCPVLVLGNVATAVPGAPFDAGKRRVYHRSATSAETPGALHARLRRPYVPTPDGGDAA